MNTHSIPPQPRWRRWAQSLLGMALLVDTLVLLALRKVNAGTILPGLLGAALLIPVWAEPQIRAWRTRRWFNRGWLALHWLAACWLLSLIGFVVVLSTRANPPLTQPPQVILILGAGLRGAEPSPILYNRLNAALALARQYPASLVVISGGQGMNEESTEALAMQRYLLQQGMAPARILPESNATSTEENMRFSRALLEARGIAANSITIAIVTSDFHAERSRQLAREAGFTNSTVVTAPTPRSIVFNAWLREYFSWIKYWLNA